MKFIQPLRNWWQVKKGEEGTPLEGDAPAWLISLVIHLGVLIILTLVFTELPTKHELVELTTVPVQDDFEQPEEFFYSDGNSKDIGANSVGGVGMADSLGSTNLGSVEQDLAQVKATQVSTPTVDTSSLGDSVVAADPVQAPSSMELSQTIVQQGASGYGVSGAEGAVDRITQEILDSLRQRKTLVVWLFDNAMGLHDSRQQILQRMNRIYDELGVVEASNNPAFKKYDDKPLLTSVIVFAKDSRILTSRPTEEVAQIKAAIASIQDDEKNARDPKLMKDRSIPYKMTFSAIYRAAEQYKSFVTDKSPRNVMFITFTDDSGDDTVEMLDKTVNLCRRYGIRNYFIGVPAPFGRKDADIKWVDFDPHYDQTPVWTKLTQGPETLLPERVRIAFSASQEAEAPLDSGFGPFGQTRLAVATGGIFFTVHPNRRTDRPVHRGEIANLTSYLKYFFDQEIMSKYRPDYVSAVEYQKRLRANRAKRALVEASEYSWISPIDKPQLEFRKKDEADLARQLSLAQQKAAKLEPKVQTLYNTLSLGKSDREKISEPRWQAGFDLAMGQVLSLKVRTEGYNIMLAKLKRGMKFQTPKDDTWNLRPSREVNGGSVLEKSAKSAEFYLRRVVDDNPGTPWAKVASETLAAPMGWEWTESFNNVNPPRRPQPSNNNNKPSPPRDDQRQMIDPPKPTRPVPRL